MTFRVGISGWRYTPWRSSFYPLGLPQRLELSFASRLLNSIEINGTFYSLQRPQYFKQWYQETPEDFVFSVKAPRFITHIKRLKDVEEPLANFFASGVLCLEQKLGPILWQFPESFHFDEERFSHFFELLPKTRKAASSMATKRSARMSGRTSTTSKTQGGLRHAVEIRHSSFDNPTFLRLLKKHQIAIVVADTADRWPLIMKRTSDFVYLRLHGDEELYASGYTDKALHRWSKQIKTLTGKHDAHIYFDNDIKVNAPFDAHKLTSILGVKNLNWASVGLGRRPDKKAGKKNKELWKDIIQES